jgi:hypothetical protein
MGGALLARLNPKPRGKAIPVLRYRRDRPKYAARPVSKNSDGAGDGDKPSGAHTNGDGNAG